MANWEETTLEGHVVKLLTGMPKGAGPHPAIVLCQHAPGLDAFTAKVCDRLAENGIASAAIDMYHRTGADHPERREKITDVGLLADIQATLNHFRANKQIDMNRVGIAGHCMGGRTALLGAASIPDAFKLLGIFWGGNIMTARGHDGPSPFELIKNVKCPVIGFFGNEDKNPSPADVDKIDAEMTKHGIAHQFHRYDGAGHAFQNFTNEQNYRERQAEDAWGKELAFFKKHLGL